MQLWVFKRERPDGMLPEDVTDGERDEDGEQ